MPLPKLTAGEHILLFATGTFVTTGEQEYMFASGKWQATAGEHPFVLASDNFEIFKFDQFSNELFLMKFDIVQIL